MNYREIIKDAWNFTRENKGLMWAYAFVPALLGVVAGIIFLAYQTGAFWHSPLFPGHPTNFWGIVIKTTWEILPKGGLGVVIVVMVAVLFLTYLLFPTFCQGALIQIIARKRNKKPAKLLDGISYGLLSFLPIFEYKVLIKTFTLTGVFTEITFVLRNLGPGILELLVIPFILLTFFVLFLALLFTYTDEFIVISQKRVFPAIGKSCVLVIYAWRQTLLIVILIFFITLRIIVNIILVLLIPSLIIISAGLAATLTLATIGYILGAVIGLIALFFAAYFNAILDVFVESIWVFTFLELTEQEDWQSREKLEPPQSS